MTSEKNWEYCILAWERDYITDTYTYTYTLALGIFYTFLFLSNHPYFILSAKEIDARNWA
jgi:hypothetical protein